jgi:hypothetical protein
MQYRRFTLCEPYSLSVSEMTVVGTTATGVYRRKITAARPLREGDVGSGAEEATRTSAAVWGLPDFVFRSVVTATGSGVRERGDALLVVGDLGAVVQVKARAVEPRDEAAERRWLDKVITKAGKQAAGTVRSVQREPCRLTNERGRTLLVDGPAVDWQLIVVVDHPLPPAGYVPDAGLALVLLRRDWEFLFEQLKSTDQVLRYVKRIRDDERMPLGREPVRYYELAAADEAAPPNELDPRYLLPGSTRLSHPLLPYAPAGQESDDEHVPLRVLMEDVARSPLPEGVPEEERVQVLAAVDATPVAYRLELGADLLRWLEECRRVVDGDAWLWKSRNLRIPDRPALIFSATTRMTDLTMSAFRSLVMLRHQEWRELMPEAHPLTVGLLITPSRQGRPWDTTMIAVKGDIAFTGEERRASDELWNTGRDEVPRSS